MVGVAEQDLTSFAGTEQQPLQKLSPPASPPTTSFGSSIAATGIVEASFAEFFVARRWRGWYWNSTCRPNASAYMLSEARRFRVDDRHLQAQLTLAEARMAAAQAQLDKLLEQPRPEEIPPSEAKVASARANADRAHDEFERTTSGRSTRGFGSRVGHQATPARGGRAGIEKRAEGTRTIAGRGLGARWAIARAPSNRPGPKSRNIRTEIERATVRAPIDGEILQVNVREGEYVSDRTQQGLVVLGRLDRLHIRADIDEHDIPYFRRTSKAVAQLRGQADHGYSLQLVRRRTLRRRQTLADR